MHAVRKRLQTGLQKPLRKKIAQTTMLSQSLATTMRTQHTSRGSAQTIKRGFNRYEAAAYIGVSPTKFDQLVEQGRMPKPMQIDGRKVWDIRELDPAFEELGNIDTSWDDVG